jgi:hypothetical protein
VWRVAGAKAKYKNEVIAEGLEAWGRKGREALEGRRPRDGV